MEEVLEERLPLGGKLSAEPTDEGGDLGTASPSSDTLRVPPSPSKGEGLERAHIRQHIENLQQQSRAFRQTLPEFDLKKELHDPMFARLTSPLVGLSVEDAYYALHRREMQQQAARITAAGLSRSIQAGRMRPEENRGNQAASVTKLNYANASKQQREELKKEIRRAAALGEKIYP